MQQQVIVTAVKGQAYYREQLTGEIHSVKVGMLLAEGDLVLTAGDGQLTLRQSDRIELDVVPNQQLLINQTPIDTQTPEPLAIEAIEQALLEGSDPSLLVEPAAIEAGLDTAIQAGHEHQRHGKATLAQAGYDTRYHPDEPENPQFIANSATNNASQTALGITPVQFQLIEGDQGQ
ncbi:MAG: retention module-containing protein, partial [Ferrimonas sp.]